MVAWLSVGRTDPVPAPAPDMADRLARAYGLTPLAAVRPAGRAEADPAASAAAHARLMREIDAARRAGAF